MADQKIVFDVDGRKAIDETQRLAKANDELSKALLDVAKKIEHGRQETDRHAESSKKLNDSFGKGFLASATGMLSGILGIGLGLQGLITIFKDLERAGVEAFKKIREARESFQQTLVQTPWALEQNKFENAKIIAKKGFGDESSQAFSEASRGYAKTRPNEKADVAAGDIETILSSAAQTKQPVAPFAEIYGTLRNNGLDKQKAAALKKAMLDAERINRQLKAATGPTYGVKRLIAEGQRDLEQLKKLRANLQTRYREAAFILAELEQAV